MLDALINEDDDEQDIGLMRDRKMREASQEIVRVRCGKCNQVTSITVGQSRACWYCGDGSQLFGAVALAACRPNAVEAKDIPPRGQLLPNLQANSQLMGQESGRKWNAAVDLQPTLHRADRLPTNQFTPTPQPPVAHPVQYGHTSTPQDQTIGAENAVRVSRLIEKAKKLPLHPSYLHTKEALLAWSGRVNPIEAYFLAAYLKVPHEPPSFADETLTRKLNEWVRWAHSNSEGNGSFKNRSGRAT